MNPFIKEEEEKQILFQSLSAYQKISGKFLELQDDIGDKDLISRNWFGEDYDQLKKKGEYRDSFSNLVTRFIGCLRQKNKKEALQEKIKKKEWNGGRKVFSERNRDRPRRLTGTRVLDTACASHKVV